MLEKTLKKVYEKPKLYSAMRYLSKAIVVLFGLSALLLFWGAYKISVLSLVKVALICAVPFVIVTLVRRLINAPRPYELYDFYEKKPKDKVGQSFPSRHVFSGTILATLTLFLYPAVGAVMRGRAVLLAVLRVLVGIHFLRDVVTGGLIGAFSAVLGVVILSPF